MSNSSKGAEQPMAEDAALAELRHKMTLDGLADVDAGRLIDHECVLAWVDSLGTDNPLPPPACPKG